MEFDELVVRPVASIVVNVIRFLVWLCSEVLFETLGWKIGWCVCRVLSLGQWPKAGLAEEATAGLLTRLLVEVFGIVVLCVVAWRLAVVFDF